MNSTCIRQLQAIADLTAALERSGFVYWLFGGWAVDFHAGRITRSHDDIDVAVWHQDMPAIRSLLEQAAWRHAPEPDEDGGTGFDRGGVRLEFTYLEEDERGQVFIPLTAGRAYWGRGALDHEIKELNGVRVRSIGFAMLLEGKSRKRDGEAEAEKDGADFEVLSGLRP